MHEGGWTITGNPRDGTLRFHRPTGGPVTNTPARAPTHILKHFGLDAA